MLTLAIDTSEDICALALGRDRQLICEYHFHTKMSLLRRLVPSIERLLQDVGCSQKEIDGIIICIGPGSFTGLRIGVTTAKSLAYALDVPIVGVGTLDAIARSAAPTAAEIICPMIHARTKEVYWSLFDPTGQVRLAEYEVGTLHAAMDAAAPRAKTVHFCGSGAVRNAEEIRHLFGENAVIGEAWSAFARGAAILEIGDKRLREKSFDDAFALTPMYIRKPTPVVRLETGEFEKPKK